jgi:hypothetical protein
MDKPPNPDLLFKRASLRTVVEHAASALRAKRGFSLLRLGDGEGPILCWPQHKVPDEMARVLKTWFGHSDFPSEDLDEMARQLRRATRNADVLGLPRPAQIAKVLRCRRVFDAIEQYDLVLPSQMLTDAAVHSYLQWSGALSYLLRGQDHLGVIGCRDIGPQIADAFGIRSVRMYLVRGENRYPGPVSLHHWPGGYTEIMQQLDDVQPGTVFLIGAGLLGKIYCDRIKSKGGIAIDVGSVLDGWAGIPSRPRHVSNPSIFTLDHAVSAGSDWEQMNASLKRCLAEVDIPDPIGALDRDT